MHIHEGSDVHFSTVGIPFSSFYHNNTLRNTTMKPSRFGVEVDLPKHHDVGSCGVFIDDFALGMARRDRWVPTNTTAPLCTGIRSTSSPPKNGKQNMTVGDVVMMMMMTMGGS